MSFSSLGSWNIECAFAMSVAGMLLAGAGPEAVLAVTLLRIRPDSSEMRSER